ncbi:uncharacterized protein C2orf15 homolog isoform 1-T1 [Dugong dugon]
MRKAVPPPIWNTCCFVATALGHFYGGAGTVLGPRSVDRPVLRAALGLWEVGAFSCRSQAPVWGSLRARGLLLAAFREGRPVPVDADTLQSREPADPRPRTTLQDQIRVESRRSRTSNERFLPGVPSPHADEIDTSFVQESSDDPEIV